MSGKSAESRKTYILGEKDASWCLIQAVDDHDSALLQAEYEQIRSMCGGERFVLAAFHTMSWNEELSPWPADPVFGTEPFGGKASGTLEYVLEQFLPEVRRDRLGESENVKYVIGGYSLAGLFALWASCQTDLFAGCAAASPSVWFPGWLDYVREHPSRAQRIYLSLGDKEEKTRNRIMRTVGDCIRTQAQMLEQNGTECLLEWNQGNHFRDADLRTAKAFAWCMRRQSDHET